MITNAATTRSAPEAAPGTTTEPETTDQPRFRLPGLTKLRLRAVWLIVPVFFLLARPTPELIGAGAVLAVLGNLIRAWAAGTIHKNVVLTIGGPYAHTRNPLYLGTLLIGSGLAVAGGRWFFVLGFLAFFVTVYGMAIRSEANRLERVFGGAYREYAGRVPLLLPRLRPYRPGSMVGSRFRLQRYLRNREYQTGLGVLLGFLALLAKLVWL